LTRGSTCQGREAVGIGDFHPFPPPQEHRAVDPRVKPEDDGREEADIVSRVGVKSFWNGTFPPASAFLRGEAWITGASPGMTENEAAGV